MLCQFEWGKHDTFIRGSVAFIMGEGSVMYKSLRTRKSNYVQRLCLVMLVVPFVSRPDNYCPYLAKAHVSLQQGTWYSTPKQTAFFLLGTSYHSII